MTIVDAYDSSLNQLTNISSVLGQCTTQIYIYTIKLSGLVWGLAATQPSVYILQLSWVNSRNDYAVMIEISWYYYYYEFILQTQIMVAILSASSLMNPT